MPPDLTKAKFAPYVDMSIDLSGLGQKEIDAYHEDRLNEIWEIAQMSLTIPRRIGIDATPTQLAADRKASRFVCTFTSDLAKRWERVRIGKGYPHLFIDDFLHAHRTWESASDWALGRLVVFKQQVATFAWRHELKSWGNSRIHLLEQETRYWVQTKEKVENGR